MALYTPTNEDPHLGRNDPGFKRDENQRIIEEYDADFDGDEMGLGMGTFFIAPLYENNVQFYPTSK